MYERNASVIDKYFGEKFGYRQTFNLKNNFANYCELLDKINELKDKRNAEKTASLEYNETCQKLKEIQDKHKKISDKVAGNDYNRNILFSNINDDVTSLRKCFEKIEGDISKSQAEIEALSKEFCDCVADYQAKKSTLEQIKSEREGIEQEYKAVFLKTKENYEKVNGDFVKYISKYTTDEIKKTKKELIDIITKNGAKEKIPFDTDVVSKAAEFATDVYKRIAEANVNIYDKTGKLIEEILGNSVKLSRHLKWRKDGVANIKFFDAEEQYLVQFLDNERIPVMHGAKIHRKLMLDACKNMVQDVEQMNNLYELILREIAGRSAKKAYKELYAIDYIENIEREERSSKIDSTAIDIATVINSNYWRIEGMRTVYNTFDSIVTELYEKDLDDIFPKAKKEEVEENNAEEDDDVEIEFELPKAKTIDKLTDADDSEDQIVSAVENLTDDVDEGEVVEEFEEEAEEEEEVGVAKLNELDESIGDIFADDDEEAIIQKVEDKKNAKKKVEEDSEKKVVPRKVTAKKVSKKEEIEAILGDDTKDIAEAKPKSKVEKEDKVEEETKTKTTETDKKEEKEEKSKKESPAKDVAKEVEESKSTEAKKAFKEIKVEDEEKEEDEDIQKVIDLKYAKLADEIDMLDEEDDEIEVPIKSKKSTGNVGKKTTASEVFQKIDSTQNAASSTEDDLIFGGNDDYSSDSLFTSINDAKKTQEDLYSALNQINSKPKRKKKGFLGLF